MRSEFGKGFIYNLFLFAKHFEREDLLGNNYWMWFNAAGDHFFELEIPKQFENKNWAKRLRRLRKKVLDYRLPYKGLEEWEKEEVFKELEKIIILIDKDLGANPVKATWN